MKKRFYKSTNDVFLTGVCGGVAEYFNIDPSIVRIVVVLLALFTKVLPIFIIYILLAIILPERN